MARAEEMGCTSVSMTAVNCLFVIGNGRTALREFEIRFEALFPVANLVSVITTYDGRYYLSRKPPYGMTSPLPWWPRSRVRFRGAGDMESVCGDAPLETLATGANCSVPAALSRPQDVCSRRLIGTPAACGQGPS